MPTEGMTNDYITTREGIRIPRAFVSPEVAAKADAEKAAFNAPAVLENIGTTAKEVGNEYLSALNPLDARATATKAIEGVATIGEKSVEAASAAANAVGLPMASFKDLRALYHGNTGGQIMNPEEVAKHGKTTPGSIPNSPNAMALQTAMSAQPPADSITLKASPGITPQFAGYGGVKKELDAATGQQSAAAMNLANVEAQRAAEVQGEHQGRMRAMEQEEQRRQAIEQHAQQISSEQIQKAETLQGELRKMASMKIDPNHFWADKSTGDRMMAAFGVFLGGLGGGENQALGILNRAIDRDISAQVSNWENARKLKADEIEGQRNIYGMYLQATGDERAAAAGSRAAALEMFNQRIETAKQRFDAPEAKARAEAAQAALQKELAGAHKTIIDAVNDKAYKTATLQMQGAELEMRAQAAHEAAQAKVQAAKKETYVPGVGVALDPESKKKVQEIAGAYNETKAALEQMQALRKESGGGTIPIWDAGLTKRMQAAQAEYIGAANKMKKFGALDNGTQEVLGQLVGGDITKWGDGIDKVLAQGSSSLKRSFSGLTKPYMAQYDDEAKELTSMLDGEAPRQSIIDAAKNGIARK